MTIRRAHPDDAEFLAWAVIEAARSHRPRGFWDLLVPEPAAEREAIVRALLLAEQPSWWHWSRFWVALRDGRPVATLAGFDPTRILPPDVALPAASAACGFARGRLAAGFARSEPLFACFHEASPGAWIVESVATRPEARGAGVARSLVEHVVAEGRAAGHPVAQLSLMIGNTAAQRLYERAGFTIEAEKRSAAFEAALGCPGIAKMSCPL